MDITNSGFLSKLQETNSSVALVFSSSATMPASINPSEVIFAVNEAYYQEQRAENQAGTGAPYINTVGPSVPQVVLFDVNGNPYQEIVRSVRIRQQLTVNDVVAAEGLTII